MKPIKIILLIVGCILLSLSAFIICYIAYINHYRSIILEQPVRIEEGYSLTRTFTVDVATWYVLGVQCERNIPFEKLKDILIRELTPSYSISDGQTTIASSESSKTFWNGYTKKSISKDVCSFEAKPGKTYTVNMRFTHTFPELAPTNPMVQIAVNMHYFTDAYVATAIFGCCALALALVGLICVAPYAWSKRSFNWNGSSAIADSETIGAK